MGHGAAEKDFYVSITPVGDVQTGTAQTRVVIPAAEPPAEDAELAEDEDLYTDPINLKEARIEDQGNEVYSYNRNTGELELKKTENPGKYPNGGISYNGRSFEDQSESDFDDFPDTDSAYVCFRTLANIPDKHYTTPLPPPAASPSSPWTRPSTACTTSSGSRSAPGI